MFQKGEVLIHNPSHKKCSFLAYETENKNADDCAWVLFERIGFRRNQEKLVYIGNLSRL